MLKDVAASDLVASNARGLDNARNVMYRATRAFSDPFPREDMVRPCDAGGLPGIA